MTLHHREPFSTRGWIPLLLFWILLNSWLLFQTFDTWLWSTGLDTLSIVNYLLFQPIHSFLAIFPFHRTSTFFHFQWTKGELHVSPRRRNLLATFLRLTLLGTLLQLNLVNGFVDCSTYTHAFLTAPQSGRGHQHATRTVRHQKNHWGTLCNDLLVKPVCYPPFGYDARAQLGSSVQLSPMSCTLIRQGLSRFQCRARSWISSPRTPINPFFDMGLDKLMNTVIVDSCTSHNDPSAFFNPAVWESLQNDLGFDTEVETPTLSPNLLHLCGFGHEFVDYVIDLTGMQEQRSILSKLTEQKRLLEDTSIDCNIVTPASILKERRHLKADTIILTTWISTNHTPLVETIQTDDDDDGIAVNPSTLQGK